MNGVRGADELCDRPATELAALLAGAQLSARELLDAHQARIDAHNGALNAIVTFTPERAQAMAAAADEHLARTGETLGPLHGLPVAHKDLALVAGVRTTFGSPLFAEHVPDRDDLIVARLHQAGAVMVGRPTRPSSAPAPRPSTPCSA